MTDKFKYVYDENEGRRVCTREDVIECPTCEGEGHIQERRETNRDEEKEEETPSILDVDAYPTLNGLFGRY